VRVLAQDDNPKTVGAGTAEESAEKVGKAVSSRTKVRAGSKKERSIGPTEVGP